MKKYTVDEPEFNKTLIITETTDTGHADNINKAPKMAFENTLYLEKTKLDADGGDVSEAVIKTADEIEDEEYPIPAAGDKPRTFLGKTIKFLGNIKDWMTGVCLLGQIVNNCVTNRSDLPLSAAMGKQLRDAITVLNTKASKIGHTHDDRYYTETEINSKLKMISQKNPITVNTSCVSKLESSYVFRCCGWIFGLFDVTLTSTCTATYTAYLLGTIIQDYRPSANHGCLTVVATDGKDGNGNPWVNLNTNGELYLNVRNTPLSGTRNYIYFIVPA